MRLFNFAKEEAGAVTVDWVVLSAVICGFGATIIATVGDDLVEVGGNLGTNITAQGAYSADG